MFEVLEKALESGRNLGASYVELRGESGFVEYIQMDDGRVNALTQRLERGVAIRVLADGAWGFVSTGDLESLDSAVQNAFKMAKAAAKTRREPIKLAEVKTFEDVVKSTAKRDPRHVPIEEKL
ncbi:MAG: TldD/PmbA family protein, partial [Candidatus Thorarchaeota archaeon]|nr:TldD/PmbA family protein [Candidatus Thorarchaeota archaeon]